MVRLKISSDQSTLFISLIPNNWASAISITCSAMAFCKAFTIASRICFPRQARIAILNARKIMGSPTIRRTAIRTISPPSVCHTRPQWSSSQWHTDSHVIITKKDTYCAPVGLARLPGLFARLPKQKRMLQLTHVE